MSPSPPPGPGRRPRWWAVPARTSGAAGSSTAWPPSDVDVSRFALLPGVQTQLAFVASTRRRGQLRALRRAGARRWPHVARRPGRGDSGRRRRAADQLQHARRRRGARGDDARPRTRRSRAGARWCSTATCGCTAGRRRWTPPRPRGACVPGATLVRANHGEAELMTGERIRSEPRPSSARPGRGWWRSRSAPGARSCAARPGADVAAVSAEVRSTVGAGDAFTGCSWPAWRSAASRPAQRPRSAR